jgi:hypothetical protein
MLISFSDEGAPLSDAVSYVVAFVLCCAIVAEGDTRKAKRKESAATAKALVLVVCRWLFR